MSLLKLSVSTHGTLSAVMPKNTQIISEMVDGEKNHVQKWLILCNRKEDPVAFKEEHSDTFIQSPNSLRIVRKTQHLCLYYHNRKLMISGMKLNQINDGQFRDTVHQL